MEDLLSLVGAIYDAAMEVQLWPRVLERIADMAHGTTTALSVHEPTKQWGTIVAGVRGDPVLRAKYEAYYCRINPHIPDATIAIPVGGVGIGQSAISDEALAQTEYYNDFLKPQDIFHMAGGVISREGLREYLYTTSRPRRKGQFQAEDLAVIKAVMPHLAHATRISREMTISGRIMQSFESLQIGLVLVDSRGQAVITNARADEIFNQKDGLALNRSGQIVTHAESEASLLAPLFGAIGTALGKGMSPGGDLLIERPSKKKSYRVSISPLRLSHFSTPFRNVSAAVFLTDPEREMTVNTQLLQTRYRVTKAEAAVATLMAQGKDLDEVCALLGVQKTTGRTHLRALMQKLGAKRQSELVLTLARMVGPISPL